MTTVCCMKLGCTNRIDGIFKGDGSDDDAIGAVGWTTDRWGYRCPEHPPHFRLGVKNYENHSPIHARCPRCKAFSFRAVQDNSVTQYRCALCDWLFLAVEVER